MHELGFEDASDHIADRARQRPSAIRPRPDRRNRMALLERFKSGYEPGPASTPSDADGIKVDLENSRRRLESVVQVLDSSGMTTAAFYVSSAAVSVGQAVLLVENAGLRGGWAHAGREDLPERIAAEWFPAERVH